MVIFFFLPKSTISTNIQLVFRARNTGECAFRILDKCSKNDRKDVFTQRFQAVFMQIISGKSSYEMSQRDSLITVVSL